MLTYGEFDKSVADPFTDEDSLIKIADTDNNSTVVDRTTFRFENNRLYYKREVNGEQKDLEVEHAIDENHLQPIMEQTWTEVFFYGIGNKRVAEPIKKRGE